MMCRTVPALLSFALSALGVSGARGQGADAAQLAGPPAGDGRRPAAAIALEEDLHARLGEPQEGYDLDLVMLGEDFHGAEPRAVRWVDGGSELRWSWKRFAERERGTYSYALAAGAVVRLPRPARPDPVDVYDREGNRRAIVDGSRIFSTGRGSQDPGEILRMEGGFENVLLAEDGAALFFEARGSIWRQALDGPGLREVLRLGDGPREEKGEEERRKREEEERRKGEEGLAGFHLREQRALFRILFERYERRERERREREELRESPVPVYHPPRGMRVAAVRISPAGRFVAVSLVPAKPEARIARMPDYVAEDGYVATRETRAKVGDAVPVQRLEVVDLEAGGRVHPVLPPGSEANVQIERPSWSPDGRFLVARAAEGSKQAWLLKILPESGEHRILHSVRDEAWVLPATLRPRWVPNTSRVVFLSEESGWRHLYMADVEAETDVQLTEGRFEIASPEPASGGTSVFALATQASPFDRDLVRIDLLTGGMELISSGGSVHGFALSPDGERVAEVFSKANRPPELRLRWLKVSREPLTLTDSPSAAWKSLDWIEPPIVQIPASDGVSVPARIYRPDGGGRNGPAVLFVHGAGYLQNVHNWWSQYSREYGFHHILRARGYTVLDVDYRGSAGYGRDWRTAIYGHMGGRDLEDFVDAARWLVDHEGVDPSRIGIYGGSYGGFVTLMAMFTKPGIFAAGAALRPVADWAHYNQGYTSNILNDPLTSPEFYGRSSPIHFAEGLRGPLLLCHGILDDNVHVQDVIRLSQRLIELRKRDFEVALYPLEGHAFRDAASWSDQYRRIEGLFARALAPR